MRGDMVLWAALAVLLIAAESFVPGAFLLWLGLAAAGVFVLVGLVEGLGVLAQVVAFVVLAFLSIGIYRRWFRRRGERSDQPLLNRRAEQLVGRVVPLQAAIADGQGRVRIDDAWWTVTGPALAQGTPVRVVAVQGSVLVVEPA